VALNRGLLLARERPAQELAAWVRREEEYATLGAEVVVELNSESRTRRPATRAWAIIRRAHRAHQRTSDRQHRGERRLTDRPSRADRTSRSPAQAPGAGGGGRRPLTGWSWPATLRPSLQAEGAYPRSTIQRVPWGRTRAGR
jgi:hypothetical protein